MSSLVQDFFGRSIAEVPAICHHNRVPGIRAGDGILFCNKCGKVYVRWELPLTYVFEALQTPIEFKLVEVNSFRELTSTQLVIIFFLTYLLALGALVYVY